MERVKSLRLESQPPRTPVSRGPPANRPNGGESNPPLSGDASPVAQRRVAGDINTCTANAESLVEPETRTQVEQGSRESPAGPPRGEHSLGDPGLTSETWGREEGEANPISGVLSEETSDELQSLQEEFLKEVEASRNDLSGQCRFNCHGRRIDPELLKQVDSLILRHWTAEGGTCEDPFWVLSSLMYAGAAVVYRRVTGKRPVINSSKRKPP